MLKRIHVTYTLRPDPDADRDTIERVHGFHRDACPVYRSIHPQVHCTTSLEFVDPE